MRGCVAASHARPLAVHANREMLETKRGESKNITIYEKKGKRKIREGEGARERNIGRVLVMRVRRYVRVNI